MSRPQLSPYNNYQTLEKFSVVVFLHARDQRNKHYSSSRDGEHRQPTSVQEHMDSWVRHI